jgi:hypothetical protein
VLAVNWVFKLKVGADGSVERYKARLVAPRSSEQISPVVRIESLRTLIAGGSRGLLRTPVYTHEFIWYFVSHPL